MIISFFFFSSRRRHTRWPRDWSSDVCSSDLENLSELRASFRLGELKKIQRIIVRALNPSRLGYNGFIGFHSDYVYPYLFRSEERRVGKEYRSRVRPSD